MRNPKGFTLIEVLIALSIFAILATITSSTLYYAFTTRTRVNDQSDRLNALQLAFSLMQQDTVQIADRAIRGNEMSLFPVFTGLTYYLEFTRDGYMNPDSRDKRSTLKRIAYVCEKGALIRRTWDSLDSANRNKYQDKPLLRQLDECHFSYLNQNLNLLSEWREQAVNQDQHQEVFPKAIQINLKMRHQGEMNLLFTIPEAMYAGKQ